MMSVSGASVEEGVEEEELDVGEEEEEEEEVKEEEGVEKGAKKVEGDMEEEVEIEEEEAEEKEGGVRGGVKKSSGELSMTFVASGAASGGLWLASERRLEEAGTACEAPRRAGVVREGVRRAGVGVAVVERNRRGVRRRVDERVAGRPASARDSERAMLSMYCSSSWEWGVRDRKGLSDGKAGAAEAKET